LIPFILCNNIICNQAEKCYRLRASINDNQERYHNFINICNSENNYQMMMKIRPDDKIDDIILELNSLEEFIEEGEN